MNTQDLKKQLMAIGASAHAILLQSEILVQEIDKAEAELTAEAQLATTLGGECEHPTEARLPAGVMGKPNRFHCRACNKTINGDDK